MVLCFVEIADSAVVAVALLAYEEYVWLVCWISPVI